MVTNMSSQLQESFPLSRAAGSFEISFTFGDFLYCLYFSSYNFIAEFHNIFMTGILR